MEVGEGVPLEIDPDYWVKCELDKPYPPAPDIPQSRRVHFFYYRRIRSAADCERHFTVNPVVPVSLDLFPSWGNPTAGIIPMPKAEEQRLASTHVVVLTNFSSQHRQFRFRNTWGETWGDHGDGFLPYDYFDKYVFESWAFYLDSQLKIEVQKEVPTPTRKDRRWVARDEWDRRVYGFEIWDNKGSDRMAWSFVIEKEGSLEVEELYVRPEFRRAGYGKVLATKVRQLADAKRLPLKLWVPFADTRQENETNYRALVAIARLLGVQFQLCPVIWAAYFATDERPGELNPVEPARIPPRPKSTLGAVLAAAALSMSADHGQLPPNKPVTPIGATQEESLFPVPETPFEAWTGALGATAEEVKNAWEDLQRRGLAAVKGGKPTVSPLALRRANSPVQRRLAAHLAGFLLTENSFIVRRAGEPPGSPSILNTRITVEHIAQYFKEGWGVTDIQRDLPQLIREEIEAAIHYYLNHRDEIEQDLRRSREMYAAHAPKQESMPT
jgi:uncharacterized protein (DUF433 family)/GNAT superfamily N-acetyltransferase